MLQLILNGKKKVNVALSLIPSQIIYLNVEILPESSKILHTFLHLSFKFRLRFLRELNMIQEKA